jgi:hypothetical protein
MEDKKMDTLTKVAIILTALGMSVTSAILGIIYGFYVL